MARRRAPRKALTSASILAASDPACKRFKTLQARFALAGHALVRTAAGEAASPFYAVRRGWLKPLTSLDEAERFLAQIGGTSCDAAKGAGNA